MPPAGTQPPRKDPRGPRPSVAYGPGTKQAWRDSQGWRFICIPHHAAIIGSELAAVGPGEVMEPRCNCAGIVGQHAKWDCPGRYFHYFNRCPGFSSASQRDPAAWTADGQQLLPATRDAWKQFIASEELTLPKDPRARARNPFA